jgi:lipase chaperone LimK
MDSKLITELEKQAGRLREIDRGPDAELLETVAAAGIADNQRIAELCRDLLAAEGQAQEALADNLQIAIQVADQEIKIAHREAEVARLREALQALFDNYQSVIDSGAILGTRWLLENTPVGKQAIAALTGEKP